MRTLNYIKVLNKKLVRLIFSSLSLLLLSVSPSLGQEPQNNQALQKEALILKKLNTAQYHLDKAETWRKTADEYRDEIAKHKTMLAAYRKTVAMNPKDVNENPYLRKMRLHCERLINSAATSANEAEEMSRFHTLRAKELEGR